MWWDASPGTRIATCSAKVREGACASSRYHLSVSEDDSTYGVTTKAQLYSELSDALYSLSVSVLCGLSVNGVSVKQEGTLIPSPYHVQLQTIGAGD